MHDIFSQYQSVTVSAAKVWFDAGNVNDFIEDSGGCIKYKSKQIAVFNFHGKTEWYASQNLCPHKLEMVLSRGMIGSSGEIPKVACPMHKKTFSLIDGECLSGDEYKIATYPVKIENNRVLIGFLD
jgi:nitrite reductase (NADH) small subunit